MAIATLQFDYVFACLIGKGLFVDVDAMPPYTQLMFSSISESVFSLFALMISGDSAILTPSAT